MDFGERDPSLHTGYREIIRSHNAYLDRVEANYQLEHTDTITAHQRLLFEAQSGRLLLTEALSATTTRVTGTTISHFSSVSDAINIVANNLRQRLTPDQDDLLSQLERGIQRLGSPSYDALLIKLMRENDQATRTVFDRALWHKAVESRDLPSLDRLIQLGSTPSVRQGFLIGLDRFKWEDIRQITSVAGRDAPHVRRLVGSASCGQASEAFNIGLEMQTWAKIMTIASQLGLDSPTLLKTVNSITDPVFKNIVVQRLGAMPNPRGGNPYSNYGYGSNSTNQTNSEAGPHTKDKRTSHTGNTQATTRQQTEARPVDPRIAILQGKETGVSKSPYVTVLANIDHHRAKGKSDAEIYQLLAKHFHPDSGHKNASEIMPVVTASYDRTTKRFKV